MALTKLSSFIVLCSTDQTCAQEVRPKTSWPLLAGDDKKVNVLLPDLFNIIQHFMSR